MPPDDTKKGTKRPVYQRAAQWLLRFQGSPRSIALGLAVGVFVALTPTVGIQMLLGGMIAHVLKVNRAIAVAAAWITNPLTMGPIYYFNYLVGLVFLPGDKQAGKDFIQSLSTASLSDPSSLWQAVVLTAQQLWGVAGVLWLGSLIVATVAAVIVYPATYHIIVFERKKLETVSDRQVLAPTLEPVETTVGAVMETTVETTMSNSSLADPASRPSAP